jgi:hypothetical protein
MRSSSVKAFSGASGSLGSGRGIDLEIGRAGITEGASPSG